MILSFLEVLWRQVKMADGRLTFVLKCSECGSENYNGSRNKKLHAEKMEVLKYCPKCNKKTVHKEKK